MAMIENIRKRRGLLIFFIGIGMLGFLIPYDAVMSLFGRTPGSETIGEINGKAINAGSFQKNLLSVQQSNLYRGDDNISSAAWSDLVNDMLYEQDLEAAGYMVGEDEYDDLRFGVSPSAMVKQAYYGGTVTEESRTRARDLFEQQPPVAERAQREMIIKRYKLEKLESLLKKGFYANTLDAERDHLMKNDKAKVSFVGVKYADVSDSLVTVTDGDVRSYFNKNKNNVKYRQNPFREVSFISYDVLATAQDSMDIKNKLADLKAGFQTTKDDSLYVVDNSFDRTFSEVVYEPGTTAGDTDSLLVNGAVGTVVGPYEDGGSYKLAKVIDKKPVVSRVNGRHIFLTSGFQRAEKDSVMAIADSLKTLLEGGASFSSLAAEWSADDSTATKGGVLGWLSPDDEVNADEKVKNQLRTALINSEKNEPQILQVPGGISLVEATNFEYDGKNSVLAVIAREIKASDDTQDELYAEVSSFALQYSSAEELLAAAEEEGLTVTAQKVTKNSRNVPSLQNSGSIVRWVNGRDTQLDDISKIYELEGKYIVATVTKVQDDRVPAFATVEDDVREDATKAAKYEMLKSKMSTGTLDDIEGAVDGASKKTLTLSFNSNNISGIGSNEMEAVGLAFGSPAEEGIVTNPVKGNDGVIVLQVEEKTLAPTKESYADTQSTLQQTYGNLYNRIKSSLTRELVQDDRNR